MSLDLKVIHKLGSIVLASDALSSLHESLSQQLPFMTGNVGSDFNLADQLLGTKLPN